MRIISGIYRSRVLVAPGGTKTRPTSDRARESLFNMLTNMTDFRDAVVLDLFAGSGAFGLEAISRGAARAVEVDSSRDAQKAIERNAQTLGCGPKVRIARADVYSWIAQAHEMYDVIFADPPYDDERTLRELPEALFSSRLLTPDSIVIIEHRSGSDIIPPDGAEIVKERTASLAKFTFLQRRGSTHERTTETGDLSGDVRSDHERTP
ncbi:MAG: 16S rRNA (guanine(966)-N(2))-methyltransferase RsmD [Bacteroidetes bacterium]|nr:16S rRNA (guanine(966)-N(2))-methyltransferase RsmD [Bacteroidota bacterium]